MLSSLFFVIILIFSIIAHEVAHGLMADYFGDRTARHAGRLTLNPISHIDLFGSIILPVLSIFSGTGAIIGWAKPVPYNPYNLTNQRTGEAFVAAAGVMMNFLIAAAFGLFYRYGSMYLPLGTPVLDISLIIVTVNLSLGLFNLLPLPPFDGLRIITSLVPTFGRKILNVIDRFGTAFTLVSLFIALAIWPYIYPVVGVISKIITGQNVL